MGKEEPLPNRKAAGTPPWPQRSAASARLELSGLCPQRLRQRPLKAAGTATDPCQALSHHHTGLLQFPGLLRLMGAH